MSIPYVKTVKKTLIFFLFLFSISALSRSDARVVINELMASNSETLADEDGDFSDWLELRNTGTETVDLDGWYLTDTAENLRKWRLPGVTLEAGAYRIVFASGKDRTDPAGELHTNFRLSASGEYLALVRPDGMTVEYEYEPYFPEQHRDVSYGVSPKVSILTPRGAAAAVRVPTDGSAGSAWTLPEYDDSSWTTGPTGIGYDADQAGSDPGAGVRNVALGATASQSSTCYGFPASLAIDGDYRNFTHTCNTDPGAWWQVDLGGTFYIETVVLHNRTSCCGSRLRDITVSILDPTGETVVFESELLNPENELGGGQLGVGPAALQVDVAAATGGPVAGGIVRVYRAPDPDLSGTGGEGGKDEAYVISLGEAEVFASEVPPGYGELIGLDLQDVMYEVNASVYIRIPFEVEDPSVFKSLWLRMNYDDGFVAYLNGTEVARRNAPATLTWNSSAPEERDDKEAFRYEEIDLSQYLELLRPGANVLAVHGLNHGADDPDLLILPELAAQWAAGEDLRFFRTPTPGAANDPAGVIGFVGDTKFNPDRGFYDEPFRLELSTETAGARIMYTLDGSAPSPTRGLEYTGPILIEKTTIVRAMAYRSDLEPTDIDTHTYIFLDDIIASGVMDPAITRHPTYGPQMRDALTDLPTISLVTTETINNSVEVGVSIEMIFPENAGGFQENAGIKYYGGAFTNFAKKNFRIYFRGIYGARKLKFPLFAGHDRGFRAVRVFDQLELRGGSHDMNQRGFYMSNRFCDDTMLDMGNLNPHGQFVHLYINGTYWGQYHLRERWNADMLAHYLGGEKEDYEAINGNWNVGGWADPGVPYDGDGTAWTRIKSLRNDYEAIKPYLDVRHYVDFMLLWMFGNAEMEYRCVGPKGPGSGFKFYVNDADGFTRNAGDRTVMDQPGRREGDGPGSIFSMLLAEGHPDYLMLLADRIHKHYFNDGAMTPEKTTARLLERCRQIERAFIAESARWGYRTPASWAGARDAYVKNVLPSRTATVISQFRRAGFYPDLEAPVFSRHGGVVERGFTLTITSEKGITYYTLDGGDPRLPGGAISPTALEMGSPSSVTLLDEGAQVHAFVPQDDSLGLTWTAVDFDDSGWIEGTTGVGYDRNDDFDPLIGTDLEAALYRKRSGVYIRLRFSVADPTLYSSLRLRMKYDDGYAAYLNGTLVAERNTPAELLWNSSASASHSDNLAVEFETVELGEARDLLRPGWNVLAVHGLNSSSASTDMLIVPRLDALEAGAEYGIVIEETTTVRARARLNGEWSALTEAVFRVPRPIDALRVTELMYHPRDDEEVDGDAYEFLELKNAGDSALDLTGLVFSQGISFAFPEGTVLGPNAFLLIVSDEAAFLRRYPRVDPSIIAGVYSGNLSNTGERITLLDGTGYTVVSFRFDDQPPWPSEADGFGRSLVPLDRDGGGDLENPFSWRASAFPDGSPGEDDPGHLGPGGRMRPGDFNRDGGLDVSDAVAYLRFLFSGGAFDLPCDGLDINSGSNLLLLDLNGDSRVDVADSIYLLTYLFGNGSAPTLGTACIRLPGCPDRCSR